LIKTSVEITGLHGASVNLHNQAVGPVHAKFLWVDFRLAWKAMAGKPLPNGMDALDSPPLFGVICHEAVYWVESYSLAQTS
jgi:hypothetical protein